MRGFFILAKIEKLSWKYKLDSFLAHTVHTYPYHFNHMLQRIAFPGGMQTIYRRMNICIAAIKINIVIEGILCSPVFFSLITDSPYSLWSNEKYANKTHRVQIHFNRKHRRRLTLAVFEGKVNLHHDDNVKFVTCYDWRDI